MSELNVQKYHTTRPCSGCFYVLGKDYYSQEEWDGEINKIRYCKSCKKHNKLRNG